MTPDAAEGQPSNGDERISVLAAAAEKGVIGLDEKIVSLGGTEQQAVSFKEGMRLGLIGDLEKARSVMMSAGFDDDFVSDWLVEVKNKMLTPV